jgi:hypothetical protein
MDEQGDYPIKVLYIAPLIMVSLLTMPSFFSTCGCFLRGGRSPSSLSSLWMASWCEWLFLRRMAAPPGFYGWRSFGCKERGAEPATEVGWAGRPGPTGLGPSQPGSVAPSLPWVLRWLCTLPPPLAWFWRCHPRVQDGGSPRMKFDFLTLQSSGVFLVALWSLPPLEVISSSSWTRIRLRKCSFELVANPSFMSMFSYINTILSNACT